MTGPTTTGSIDAKLTLDRSDFKRGMDEARNEAREVGSLAPTVKVDANVGPALAKLEAVAKAERDLDFAYQRSAISQEKLSAVTQKYGDDSTQAAAARLSHSRAIAAESDAEAKLARSKQASTVEEDKSTAATNRGNDANHRRVSGLQVLIGLAPGILAAAAPIAAGAVGLGVAFGVMGVSGVLAIKGIKDAMEVGDGVGNQYAAGLGVLKSSLDTLSATSANAMLGSFNGVVGDINGRMPFLNQMVREGSGLLGAMGGTALSGVLTGLEQMNPLIQQGGVELGKFVTWLFSFTGSDGFKEFLAYAAANLPSVMHLIESLVTLSGRLLAAFAPLGPVVIEVISALSDGLASLPAPVLAGLVVTATALGPAMKVAGAGVALFAIESQFAVPVVGILMAALTGLGIMAATAALGTDKGTASVENYTQALRDDTNQIGENVRAQAAKALVDSGAVAAAKTLGVSLEDVTAAATGNGDAMGRLKAVTDAASAASMGGVAGHRTATEAQIKNGDAAKVLAENVLGTNSAIQDGIQKNKEYDAALAAGKSSIDGHTAAVQLQAGAYGATVQAYQNASTAQQDTATKTAQATITMQLQNNAAGLLKMTLDGLNGKAISAAQAQNSFDSSLVNMGDHVSKTGKQITFTTTSIEDMSSASVALRGQLNTQVTGLQAVVAANGGLDESTGKAKEQMEAMRTQIIENAVAHGVDRDAVTAYVDKLLTIPKSVPPTKLDVDSAQAIANIESFKAHLASIQNRIVTVTEQTIKDPVGMGSSIGGRQNGSLAGGEATGGFIPEHWATGGFPGQARGTDTVPTWLTPGEHVMNRAASQSIGAPALNYMNQTGQLPPQPQEQQRVPVHMTGTLVLDSGEVMGTFRGMVQEGLDGVSRQVGGMRR